MSLLDRIDIEVNRTRDRLARLQQIREMVVEMESGKDAPPAAEENGASKLKQAVAQAKSPPPSTQGGTLDGRIMEALQFKAQGAFAVADRLEEDREAVKVRLEMLLAEGHIERGRGGVYRCVV